MSFQAYPDNIQANTGKSPTDWRAHAAERGWLDQGSLRPEVKAGAIVADLKSGFALGHGHAMAIVALLDQRGRGVTNRLREDINAPALESAV